MTSPMVLGEGAGLLLVPALHPRRATGSANRAKAHGAAVSAVSEPRQRPAVPTRQT
jgi:hypothetical protein